MPRRSAAAVVLVPLVLAAVAFAGGCTPGSPQDAADEAWNRHIRSETRYFDLDDGLVNRAGSPVVGNGCVEGRRVETQALTLYDCTITFADGTRWGGRVRVDDDGKAFIRTALHPLPDEPGG